MNRTLRQPRRAFAVIATAALFSLAILTPIHAQGRGDGIDPLKRHLFPPELVMSHQAEIGLDSEQRASLIAEIQSLQADVVPLQFEMREAVEELTRLLGKPHVDEAAALALAERITGFEARVKQRHLTMLLRVKNLLSGDQQNQLRALRRSGRG